MSTSCQIGFYRFADVFPRNAEKWDPKTQPPETLLYIHHDGHPEQVMKEIIEFLHRWNPKQNVLLGQEIDIEYLSARFLTFIIWNRQGMIDASQKHDLSLCGPKNEEDTEQFLNKLKHLSFGISEQLHINSAYFYAVIPGSAWRVVCFENSFGEEVGYELVPKFDTIILNEQENK